MCARYGLLALALMATTPARASAADLEETETVTVREAPYTQDTGARDVSVFATVIERSQFEGREADLGRILDQTVGLEVRSYGGLGDFSTISIRGSTSDQVEIFLDGIPVNRASGGGVDLSTLPLDSVERIEVYRGTAPADLGIANVGGAIDLVTPGARGADSTSASVGFGSFGTVRASGRIRRGTDKIGLMLGAGYDRTDGDFSFHDDNGTPKNRDDDETVDRRNNGYDAVSTLAKADADLVDGLEVSLANDFFWKDEGVPGIGSYPSTTASLRTLRDLAYLRFASDDDGDAPVRGEQRFEASFQEQRFDDRNGEIGVGSQRNRDRTLGIGSVTRLVGPELGPVEPHALLDLRREVFEPSDEVLDPPDGPSSDRNAANLALEGRTSFADGRWLVDPVLRLTYVDDHRRPWAPLGTTAPSRSVDRRMTGKLGARGALTDVVEVRGNVARSFRPPSFSELFGDRGSVVGNPTLKPEHGLSGDLGVALTPSDFGAFARPRLETIGFWRDTDDLILFIQTSQRTAVARNIASARAYGLEVVASSDLPLDLRLSANFTYQRTEDRSPIPSRNGNDLPGQPRLAAFGRLAWRYGPLQPFAELHYLGESFLDPANLAPVPDRALLNLGFDLRPSDEITVGFEVRNVTDNQVSDVFGFPLPGTSFYGSITANVDALLDL